LPEPIYIEIVTSPGCVHSPKAVRIARQTISKLDDPIIMREVSIATAEGMQRAREFEVQATPAIAINGRVAYVGVPSIKLMGDLIRSTLWKEKEKGECYF